MQTSLPYHDEPVRVPAADQFTVRLCGLSPQQLHDAMTFVAFWSPGTFTATSDPTDMTRLASAAGNRPVIITC